MLRLRYGYLSDLTIPRAAITGARIVRRTGARSGKLTRDPHGEHHYPCGQTTVALELDQTAQLALRGQPVEATIHTLHVTADDAASFAEAVAGNRL